MSLEEQYQQYISEEHAATSKMICALLHRLVELVEAESRSIESLSIAQANLIESLDEAIPDDEKLKKDYP